jgi:uncharacterized damage-inducible protein DinB
MTKRNLGYYQRYVDIAGEGEALELLERNRMMVMEELAKIPQDKESYAYQEGKWTIKQVVRHIVDCERVMAYRMLRALRGDQQACLPFEEDDFAKNDGSEEVSLAHLIQEFSLSRVSTRFLLTGITQEQKERDMAMADIIINAEEIGKMIVGHTTHHIHVLKERYL